ncbi:toprim domain-containing protein [Rahnella sp. BCC 1045]|uniref:DUF7146 domain-containing protein n=1 Tax=Rahnella sp. BCC 1045 TaxID=2816251 RepID=UPI001C27D7B2|nr:toprim domain-containing protein [Rahnella sp. BCC 1045]MBU9819945.1 toprim domain-containing protein [Rahnella sp. BCC 1045]
MKTTEAVIGRWPDIFEYYGLPPVTGKMHFKGECPCCGKKGKYRCDDLEGRGRWICSCGTGDGWNLLVQTQKKDIRTLYNEVDRIIGNTFDRSQVPAKKLESDVSAERDRILRHFSAMPPLRGTLGEGYLNKRGINTMPSADAIRYCPNQKAGTGGVYQALWSLATDNKANLCYLHRTLLDGDKKADVDVAKKQRALQEKNVLEHAVSVAIRLFPVASTLGIAEGIETALSCKQLYGVNTWSVINAGFMEKFRVPAGVQHLVIFADMDVHTATGQAAAFACARSNLNAKNDLLKISIRWPDNGDFNDLIINGDQVREQIYYKKVAA